MFRYFLGMPKLFGEVHIKNNYCYIKVVSPHI